MKTYTITLTENASGRWIAETTVDDGATYTYDGNSPDDALSLIAARVYWERQRATHLIRFREEEKS